MGYLGLAVASSASIAVLMRFAQDRVKNDMGMFMANYVVCLLLSRIFMGKTGLFTTQKGIGTAVLLGVFSGVLYLVNFVLLQKNMRENGMALASTFMKLGVLVPVVMALLVFHEMPKAAQIVGMILAVAAILLIHFEKESAEQGKKKGLLLVLLLLSGFTDSLANVYDKMGSAAFKDHYLFCTFFAAFLAALFMAFRSREKICREDLLCGALIGVPNYFAARFLLLALANVPAVVTYPAYSVGTIVVVTAVGALVFQEKLNGRKKAALCMILAALALLNM